MGDRRAKTDASTEVEALRAEASWYRTLFEQGPVPMVIYDPETIIMLAANAAAARAYGYPASDFVGMSIEALAADPPEVVHRRNAALPEAATRIGVVTHRRQNGERFEAEITSQAIDYHGRHVRLAIILDVTDRRELEARLRVSDRMASVGTLAAGVAHEINNPLAYVIANLGFVAEMVEPKRAAFGADADEVFAALEEARSGAERVREIVRDLKTFSRSESRRGPVDIHDILDTMCAMAGNEIRHRAQLVKDYARSLPYADGDESHLGQVFLNLLVNAAQAIPAGDSEHHTIRITTRQAGEKWIEVEVSDDGVGIPEDVLGRIFDPFFTTKPVGVGTGLGLSICRNLVTSFGGEIEVDSEVGKGTTFRIRLLVRDPDDAEAEAEAPAPRIPAVRRGRILVVDDEPLIGSAVSRILGSEHEVTVTAGAAEALGRLAADEGFDIVLCDLMMPEMSGMDLWAALDDVAPWAKARTVFMTGGAFTPAAREFLETVDAEEVDKPFDALALRDLVRRRLEDAAG